ncbi:hypothetical protein ACOSQ2_012026 [Xanthoceras sorbifolium]
MSLLRRFSSCGRPTLGAHCFLKKKFKPRPIDEGIEEDASLPTMFLKPLLVVKEPRISLLPRIPSSKRPTLQSTVLSIFFIYFFLLNRLQ